MNWTRDMVVTNNLLASLLSFLKRGKIVQKEYKMACNELSTVLKWTKYARGSKWILMRRMPCVCPKTFMYQPCITVSTYSHFFFCYSFREFLIKITDNFNDIIDWDNFKCEHTLKRDCTFSTMKKKLEIRFFYQTFSKWRKSRTRSLLDVGPRKWCKISSTDFQCM